MRAAARVIQAAQSARPIPCDDFHDASQLSMKVPGGVASVFCREELGSGLFQILIATVW